MCGIIGIIGKDNHKQLAKQGLELIKYRGPDATKYYSTKALTIGHTLYAMVNRVPQPLVRNTILATNCEIYNWKDLHPRAKNDADALHLSLDEQGITAINKADGIYALAYLTKTHLYLARDLLGILPLYYTTQDGLAFASEKKALEKLGYLNIEELNPRHILKYNLKTQKTTFQQRPFFKITPLIKQPRHSIANHVQKLLTQALKKRLLNKKVGLLFSGGLDSTILAVLLKQLKIPFTCYTTALDDPNFKTPQDLEYAKKVAKELNLKLKIINIKTKNIPTLLKKIVPLIEDSNVTKVGVALTFFSACKQAKKDKCKYILSGLGSEEIFAGYQRHKNSQDINKECLSGLLKMHERDLYRDNVIAMYHSLEMRLPFLDHALIKYALRIPAKYKIYETRTKIILRDVAKNLNLQEEFAQRKKRAAQYGSNMHKALKKLAKKQYISTYLKQFYPTHNLRLGALFSSGKDSTYAIHIMQKQNYKVECLITLISKNPASYMFHTPNINLTKLQAEALEIPIIQQTTEGKKEKELKDLKKALKKAKQKYKIQGIITGALYSTYQRDRIEKIADKLNLKVFSPLWHMNQETEMRELVNSNFKIILSSIAAEGLKKEHLGTIITHKFIDNLVKINQKVSINIAFEGGEAESLVLDAPNFKKKLVIQKAKKIMENECTGLYRIEKVKLEEK